MRVHLFGHLRTVAGNVKTVDCSGGPVPTVRSVLLELVEKVSALKIELFDEDELQHGVQVLVEGRNVRLMLDGLDSNLQDEDEKIEIFPAVAGG